MKIYRNLTLALLLAATAAWAAVPPELISYQGVLRNSAGNPITGMRDMVFRFCAVDALTDPVPCETANLLLTDSQTNISVTNGLLTIQLGAGTITPGLESTLSEVFRDNAAVWLEIHIAPDVLPMTPRVRVIASAYAQNASTLQGVVNVDTSGKVGIGTDAPDVKLDVRAEGGSTIYAISGRTDDNLSYAAGVIGYGKNANTAGVIGLGGNQTSPMSLNGAGGLFTGDSYGIGASAVGSTNPYNYGAVFLAGNATTGNTGISADANAYSQPSDMTGTNVGGEFAGYSPSAGGTAESHGVNASAYTFGSGSAIGVYGWASADGMGTAYSIYGNAPGGSSPGDKYAGYFNGPVQINGTLKNLTGSAGSSGQLLQSTGTNFQWVSKSTLNDGDWTISGNDEYSAVSGNVGIGTATPGEKLDVYHGGARITDSDGDSMTMGWGGIANRFDFMYNGGASATQNLLFYGGDASNGWSMDRFDVQSDILAFTGNVGIGTTAPGYKLDVRGDGSFNNPGGTSMLFMQGLEAAWTNGTSFSWGFGGQFNCFADRVRIGATSNPSNTLAVSGDADFTGKVGIGTTAPSNPLSVNGDADFSGKVRIGTSGPNAKLHVQSDTNHRAYIVGYSPGEVGRFMHSEDPADGDGQSAIYAQRDRISPNNGTGYGLDASNSAIEGENWNGDGYTFGVYGYTYGTDVRTGGILGYGERAAVGTAWGSLGYYDSGATVYGGYFTSTNVPPGSGFRSEEAGIGLGSYGSLMGGWVRGGEYGLYASGGRYGLFSNGNSFVKGYQAFLQEDSGEKVVSYSVASPAVEVIEHGTTKLAAGQTKVEFPSTFKAMLSEKAPVTVFVSPLGQTSQVSVSSATADGFEVNQAGGRSAEAEFAWIAIGQRKGYENTEAPAELMEKDFESNMEQVAFDENNREKSALGMSFDGSLHFGAPPESSAREGADRAAPNSKPAVMVHDLSKPAASGHADLASASPESPQAEPDAIPIPENRVNHLAETVIASETVEPGDVIVVDSFNPGRMRKCASTADSAVLGVVQETASNGDMTAVVVLSGITSCKVDALHGPIQVGDLLVTSPTPGHAMKAVEPKMGTVIGKALEPLDSSTGLIKVLVMLR